MSASPPKHVAEVAAHGLFSLGNTRMERAGVMRCCLETVAEEYADPEHLGVSIGMKSCCRHCSEPFTLVDAKPHPKWMPDWALRKENCEETCPREGI